MVTYEKGILKIVDAVYEVKVVDGTGSGKYSEGQRVNITANDRSGYTFTDWTGSDGVVFVNASSKTTSFTMPAKAEISIEAKKGKNKTATAKISKKSVENAITKALEEAKKNGKEAEKIDLELKVDMPKGTNKVKVNLTGNALERIVNEEVDSLTIDSPISKTVFDKKAVSEIKKKRTDYMPYMLIKKEK